MDPLAALGAVGGSCPLCDGGGSVFSPGLGAAANRLYGGPMAGAGPMGGAMMNPGMQMMNFQYQLMQYLMGMLIGLMMGNMMRQGQMGGPGGFNPLGGGPLGGGPLGGGTGTSPIGGAAPNTGGGANTGGGPNIPTGPVAPGTEALLDHARSMIGLEEHRNTAEIQKVTGESGINPASTPWCAAFAMNLLKDHGLLTLDGLSNRNYCPTIKNWAQQKGIWGNRGQYQPKPGDAILFDWNHDGTMDHIGIVERVEGGKVITIEGNSSDQVKRNSYDLGSSNISGYVITGTGKG